MKFPFAGNATGTLTWTVLRSQYGITGRSGTLTIVKDAASNGGYKVTEANGVAAAVRATQGNFFVSASGQLSGSLPLPLGAGGSVKDAVFQGVRFLDAKSGVTDMSEFAGKYATAAISATAGTGANAGVGISSLNLNPNGTGRFCNDTFIYSDTCVNGLDIVATFDDPANRQVVRLKQAATQSQPIPLGNGNLVDTLLVVRKFGANGVSVTGDFINSGNGDPGTTGAFYGARIGNTPVNLADQIGAYNFTGKSLSQGAASNKVALNFVGPTFKSGSPDSTGGCGNPSSTLTVGPVNGVITITGGNQGTRFLIVVDVDKVIFVEPRSSLGFLSRFSTDPTKAPCQPS